ncbi:unnamed protein product [Adineta steineri]|uniref:Uncharacterized protein n=1 Tax=Adineta steineri TaxID=433720 RepID=A0A819WCQ3_9BILA|nr:unnamed protein product [Adineta steineri]CAF1067893.1 unnamed protein product [Adineta steineri]CAF4018349.1 unnamed protein product [Adineta steineri]CAF4122190.1 unnamed protein product [Adineta steineri]
MFLYTAYSAGLPSNIGASFYSDIQLFAYCAITFTPMVCALSLPELRTKFKICFPCCRRRPAAVGPQALVMTRPPPGPTAAIATIAQ